MSGLGEIRSLLGPSGTTGRLDGLSGTTGRLDGLSGTTGRLDGLSGTTGRLDGLSGTTGRLDGLSGTTAGSGGGGYLPYNPPTAAPPKVLTLEDLSKGKTEHTFKVDAAGDALFAMPVSYIQGVKNFLDGTSTLDQTNVLFQQLLTYAKTYGVGLGFHNLSKKVEVAVTDAGNVYAETDDGKWMQVYPKSPGGEVDDEAARVRAYAASGPAMIDYVDTDVTNQGLKPIAGMVPEPKIAAKIQPGKVYASREPFYVRHPVKGKHPTTTKYSYVVTQMTSDLNSGYFMCAKRG